MNGGFDRHFPESLWEEYALGMRCGEDCQLLEEHLLICPVCQDLLAEAEDYIQVASAAMLLATVEDGGNRPLVTDTRMRRRLSKPMKAALTVAGVLLWLS